MRGSFLYSCYWTLATCMNPIGWIQAIGQDLRYAVRVLRRSPWFTVAAVFAIALGIGANTAIFSVVNAVLLRPLPYRQPEELFAVSSKNMRQGRRDKVTGADFREWQNRSTVFEEMACYMDESHTITGTTNTESVLGWEFSSNLFSMLGTPPLIGRTLLADDGQPGKERVVVLSHRLWQRRFSGDPDIAGKPLQLDGQSYTIVGVMPPGFAHPDSRTEIWTAMAPNPLVDDRRLHVLHVVGRARRGVSHQAAQKEMETIARQLAQEHPDTNAFWGIEVRPIRDLYVGDVSGALLVLQFAVLFMLLISCANVANLFLARASARDREVAVRLALGAGRLQLFRQFFTEGMLIAFLGAAGGMLFALWGIDALPVLFAAQLGRVILPEGAWGWINATVVLWTMVVAVCVGLFFGAIPMFRGFGNLLESLKSGSRSSTGGSRMLRLRGVFVVSQIAFSLVLLTGAGLLMRSFLRLQERPLGFRTDNVLTAILPLPPVGPGGFGQRIAFLEDLQAQVRSLSGVDSVGLISTVPLSGNNARRRYRLPGQPEAPNIETELAEFRIVTPGYFSVLGIALRKGRLFEERDRLGGAEVVIINETLARRLWPNEDPTGKNIIVPDMAKLETRQVVGVVADTRHSGLAIDPAPEIYRPAYQAFWPFFGLVVRTNTNASGLTKSVRDRVASVDKDIPVGPIRTMEQLAADSMALRRSSMILLAAFAGMSLLLASFGVYSVISYAVMQRSREIGIRIALGATPAHVVKAVVREGAILALIGVGIGLVLSGALTRFLANLLFGVTATDAVTFGAVSLLLLTVAVMASLVPAFSAARLDPALTLRSE